MTGPLTGITVLDMSQLLPGPYATRLLADLGARVVKIEPPSGDPLRQVPPHDSEGRSLLFEAVNRGKEGVVLDLKDTLTELKLIWESQVDLIIYIGSGIKHVVMMGARDMVNRGLSLRDLPGVINASRIIIFAVLRKKEGCRAIYSH